MMAMPLERIIEINEDQEEKMAEIAKVLRLKRSATFYKIGVSQDYADSISSLYPAWIDNNITVKFKYKENPDNSYSDYYIMLVPAGETLLVPDYKKVPGSYRWAYQDTDETVQGSFLVKDMNITILAKYEVTLDRPTNIKYVDERKTSNAPDHYSSTIDFSDIFGGANYLITITDLSSGEKIGEQKTSESQVIFNDLPEGQYKITLQTFGDAVNKPENQPSELSYFGFGTGEYDHYRCSDVYGDIAGNKYLLVLNKAPAIQIDTALHFDGKPHEFDYDVYQSQNVLYVNKCPATPDNQDPSRLFLGT